MDFESWLAAMPVEDVRGRIAQLERELEVLRLLEQQHRERGRRPDVSRDQPTVAVADNHSSSPSRGGRRISPGRAAIMRLIAARPDGMVPIEVTRALSVEQGMTLEPNAVQTTLSRMVQAGQLVRTEGRYQLPHEAPDPPSQPNLASLPTADAEVSEP